MDLTGAHGLLGQVDGRTSGAVRGWLAQRSQARRDAVQLVAIDPCTPYAAAVRLLLPHAGSRSTTSTSSWPRTGP